MGKYTGTLMSSADFRNKVNTLKLKSKLKKKFLPYVDTICRLIDKYHSFAKYYVAQRQNILMEIRTACSDCAGAGMAEQDDKPHVKAVKNLGTFCIGKIKNEQARAKTIEKHLTAATGRRGLKGIFRYEKLNKPGLPGMRGDDIVQLSDNDAEYAKTLLQEYELKLTGDDGQDYYMLKKLIKEARGNTAGIAGWGLVYMNEEQRSAYKLTFAKNTVRRREKLYTTAKQNENIYAANPAGQIFAAGNVDASKEFKKFYQKMGFKFDRAAMHHSSFLSGADVMCAGTLEVIEGKLIYISNNSGHYKPNIDDLQAVCNAILIDYAPSKECYALFTDIDAKEYPALRRENPFGDEPVGNTFHFPIVEFAKLGRNIPKPESYAQYKLASRAPAAPPSRWVFAHRRSALQKPLLRGTKGKGKG
ncbi:MAG: hypothetical protein G3M70_03545 [Candidatus Nitronauta litoralis]|uniref:Uncharacterized protein n=1 Tax=Candidatus Nitronauta litoralis TaxID=2705533 RepID=A0A7T0BV51_9BACT|nr:MAG: hypothetical protein G3M70_03545 [Candidatus Nitronauta litoralis]